MTDPIKISSRMGRKSEIHYTDVVVIGNGPSGITASFMLAGNWPYYTGDSHSNEYLQLRLETEPTKSIVEQDLEFLSDGLEGRSANPVALLLDALSHPDADIGSELPPVVRWDYKPECAIPHVVLGRVGVGGAWQMMEGQMQTLSLGNWMQLPDMPFWEWIGEYRRESCERLPEGVERIKQDRAGMEDVRAYYANYVKSKNLSQYFKNYSTVTSVERVLDVTHSIDDESGEQTPCARDHCGKFKWEVRGYQIMPEHKMVEFCYRAPHVVMATGNYDKPNKLIVSGEHYPYVLHSLPELERVIQTGELGPESDPLVVIGAGLSAADAILCARSLNIPVSHIFRTAADDPGIILNTLPGALYPEYHEVHRLMKEAQQEEDESYQSFPLHTVLQFNDDHKVLLRCTATNFDSIIQASYVVVLIGVRPDLSFLPQCGAHLGIVPGVTIDGKHNKIDIDPYTYQSVHECGLYAMGPLVGDNFVRFVQGGALGITSHLWKKRQGAL